jgi:hypothetical protein
MSWASNAKPQRNDVLPRLELSYIPVDHFPPSPKRVRKLDPAHVQELAVAISALGFCDPLLVGRNNDLINGEARYEAAKQLGLDRIPCVRIEHLSKDEQRVLRRAVNRLAEKGKWDLDALKIEFEELIVTDARSRSLFDSEHCGDQARPCAPQPDCLGEDEWRHGQSLPLPA